MVDEQEIGGRDQGERAAVRVHPEAATAEVNREMRYKKRNDDSLPKNGITQLDADVICEMHSISGWITIDYSR
jgi:hypothetical protein